VFLALFELGSVTQHGDARQRQPRGRVLIILGLYTDTDHTDTDHTHTAHTDDHTLAVSNIDVTRMWANTQRDGRPAEHRWRPLFNAAKFGWRPLLDAVQ